MFLNHNNTLYVFVKVAKRGEVLKVKVLGTVALIDEGKYLNFYCIVF